MHVGLPHLESQPLGKGCSHIQLVDESSINAGNRDHAAFATQLDGFTQGVRAIRFHAQRLFDLIVDGINARAMSFHSDRVDAGIRSASARHFSQSLWNINLLIVDDPRIPLLSHAQSLRKAIDRDDALCTKHIGAPYGELTDRAATPHRNHIARLDITVLRRLVAGREDIREEEHLFIGQAIGNLDRADIGERNTRILCLPTCITTINV